MTPDERFARIEHVTAAIVEERRKDREEYRQLWRETQRHLNELTLKVADVSDAILAETARAAAAEAELRDRVDRLVSAIGEFIRRQDQAH